MTIGEVKAAYPYGRYRAVVSHFTARRSTAIEWMILAAVERCSAIPGYAGMDAGRIFRDIFQIADADQMVLPCILKLQDLGALFAEGVSDHTRLEQLPMGSLRLTPSGAEMHRRGLLPGARDESAVPWSMI